MSGRVLRRSAQSSAKRTPICITASFRHAAIKSGITRTTFYLEQALLQRFASTRAAQASIAPGHGHYVESHVVRAISLRVHRDAADSRVV